MKLIWLFLVLLLLQPGLALGEEHALKRHALLISSNDGGAGRTRLRYATRDSETLSRVLGELGGIEPEDTIAVANASPESLIEGFAEIQRRIVRHSADTKRQEVIFYYSGHSDEEGLLLGGKPFSYAKLRKMVSDLPVDVRLMIIDSCASGQLTLSKGGKRRPSFLLDSSVKAKGQAVITSASADEAAQESARIEGSFFTHYLVSGLRGAADSNGDRRVTLSEAYQYAYTSTLARTETTRGGPQHPSYDFQLAGTGDLILTDLRVSAAALVFPKQSVGRYFIRDPQGTLVAEIAKQPGQPVHLGLEPGAYTIIRGQGTTYGEAKIDLAQKQELNVDGVTFVAMDGEPAVARGTESPKPYKDKRWSFQLIPDFDEDAVTKTEQHAFMFGLLGGRSGRLDGGSLSLLGHIVEEGGVSGVQATFGVNFNKGALSGAQIGFLGNYTAGHVGGAQIGMMNWAGTDVAGAQIGMISVSAGSVRGGQIGLLNYANGTVDGGQVGYGLNWAKDRVNGAQIGMLNITQAVDGAQVGLANLARDVTATQVGLLNLVETTPAQVGLLNIARVTKAQVGLVNVAKESDWTLGLVSYVGNGVLDVGVSMDEFSFAHLTLRMGSRYLYTIYDVADRSATKPDGDHLYAQTYGLGLGVRIPVFEGFDINAEVLGHAFHNAFDDNYDNNDKSQPQRVFTRGQVLAGYRLVAGLQVFGGPSYGYYSGDKDDFKAAMSSDYKARSNRHNSRWIGWTAGLAYKFKS